MAVTFLRWHRISGRGWVAEFSTTDPEGDMRQFKPGQKATIEGEIYLVTGLEYSQGLQRGDRFGVIIRGEPKKNPGDDVPPG